MNPAIYPVNDFGPMMKGLVIGGLGIFHVFTAYFAIGGGILLTYFQWLAMTGRSPAARVFINGYFRFLVLISFVVGALTGVGMWFTSIQVSPATIGLMVDEFHWLWAIEWSFFCLEVVAGYTVYRYGSQLSDAARFKLFAIYSFAAWMSLFWINGILSFQLTPGRWLETHSLWDGFFNPTFFPSLLYRTIAAITIGALAALVVINLIPSLSRSEKAGLIYRAALLLTPMLAMPFLGAWFVHAMPEESRSWIMGGSVAMTMMMTIAVVASAIIGLYAVIGLVFQRLYINGATATLLCFLAFAASAGGEFVREGVRKPFTVREILYSNSIHPDLVAQLRKKGLTDYDPYPLRDEALLPRVNGKTHEQLKIGALVFRQQCSICHTLSGVNGITHLTQSWDRMMMRQNFSKLQKLKPFMPPFAGTPTELEALVQYVNWLLAGNPAEWPVVTAGDKDQQALLTQIQLWLDAAGTEPFVGRSNDIKQGRRN